MRATLPYVCLMVGIWLLALLPAAYYAYRQFEEERIVADYLAQNRLAGLPRSKASALRIAQQLRSDFEVDERRFKHLNMSNRPFLRTDTASLLRHKEGLCGEGARVLVNLLLHEGYDATRVVLYGSKLDSAHTVVSVRLGGREFLLDTVNSPEAVNHFLNDRDVSTADFMLLHYSDDIDIRRAFAAQTRVRTDPPFFSRFWIFSYEALPYSKLLTRARWDVRVFNFDRPPRMLSALSEKPNLLCAVGALLAAVLAMALWHASGLGRWLRRPSPVRVGY